MINPAIQFLKQLHDRLKGIRDGEVATYIPELAKADADAFGIALTTVDGATYHVGDSRQEFTIQSVSKPFAYAQALEDWGRDAVARSVGVEPTGDSFNAISLDQRSNRPHNPMVNAGAIAISSMFPGEDAKAASAAMRTTMSRFAGRPLAIDEAVFASERETGHRNRALAWLMQNSGMLKRPPDDALDVYFRQCSVSVTAIDLSVMAATLANGGSKPITRQSVVSAATVQDVLSVMLSCGMYNYAGQWVHEVGIAAKSGVSGAVVAVVPGQFGLAVWSPRLDATGNSVRGIAFCKAFTEELGLHLFRPVPNGPDVLRRRSNVQALRSKRLRNAAENAMLDRWGTQAQVFEFQGVLDFSHVERIVRLVNQAKSGGAVVILVSLAKVRSLESDGLGLLCDFLRSGTDGFAVRFLMTADGMGKLPHDIATSGAVFTDQDVALEWAEHLLLQMHHIPLPQGAAPENPLLRGLSGDEMQRYRHICTPRLGDFASGAVIVRKGDEADMLFVVMKGAVRVQVAAADGSGVVRLETMGPGLMFGEMAMLQSGQRMADVVAVEDSTCECIPVAGLQALKSEDAGLYLKLLVNLAADLAAKLKRSNMVVSSLQAL